MNGVMQCPVLSAPEVYISGSIGDTSGARAYA